MATISLQFANNQQYFETNKNRQYTAYLVVKADDEETAEEIHQDVINEILELRPELNQMYVPETEELSNGKVAYMDEIVGYQRDFDTKEEFEKAVKASLKTAKKIWKNNN